MLLSPHFTQFQCLHKSVSDFVSSILLPPWLPESPGPEKRPGSIATTTSFRSHLPSPIFLQGKGSRNISLKSDYLKLFKNPRDKLQILTLAKQMYPGQTDFFLNQYEEAVKRPSSYLLTDLKTTSQENVRQQTNVLPNEEGFNQAGLL